MGNLGPTCSLSYRTWGKSNRNRTVAVGAAVHTHLKSQTNYPKCPLKTRYKLTLEHSACCQKSRRERYLLIKWSRFTMIVGSLEISNLSAKSSLKQHLASISLCLLLEVSILKALLFLRWLNNRISRPNSPSSSLMTLFSHQSMYLANL
jgi:hypothetical protein